MEICPFYVRSRPALGSPSLLLTGYRDYLRGVKAAGAGIVHSPVFSAGIRNKWTVTPLIHTSVWRGVEHLYLYHVVLVNDFVEIKCQLDATEVFIADLIASETC